MIKQGLIPMAKSKSESHQDRVRRICLSFPDSSEKLSHGEPTFFTRNRVFVMFSNNHHNDGHIAVCLLAAPGVQAALIHSDPQTYYRPPYVGVNGWIGVELARVSDEELHTHISEAWQIISSKKPSKPKKRI